MSSASRLIQIYKVIVYGLSIRDKPYSQELSITTKLRYQLLRIGVTLVVRWSLAPG